MDPLIPADNVWTLWALMIAGTGLSIWLEQNYKWAAKISGPVIAMLIAMALTNLRVMPMEAPAYEFVDNYLVLLAIPLLLFRANIVKIARTTGSTLFAFHVAALGSLIGTVIAVLLLRDRIPDAAHVGGIMAASYIGGMINFIAVKESFGVSDAVTEPLIVADNLVMAGAFIVMLSIVSGRFFLARYNHPHTLDAAGNSGRNLAAEHWQRKPISLMDIAWSLAVAFAVVAAAKGYIASIHIETSADSPLLVHVFAAIATNRFVWITALSVLVATALHRHTDKVHGPEEIGGFMLYLFLFKIGLPADLMAVVTKMPMLFVFCFIIAASNILVTLGLGKLLRLNIEELVIAMNATLGGPPTAAAMAITKGWDRLVLPGLLVGIWGYCIGTILGVFIGELLARMV